MALRKRRKCCSWRVSVESKVLPGGKPSPCISWDGEVGIFLKKATVLSLPGDSRGWVQTLQDRAMCWDTPASGPVLTSVSAGKTLPLPLPGTLCPAGGAPENTSEMLGSILFTNHLQLPCGKQPAREGLDPGALCSIWRTGKKRCMGSRNGVPVCSY